MKAKEIRAIRFDLQQRHDLRQLAMLNLAVDSKLRGCDLVALRIGDVSQGGQVMSRASVVQRKTQRPVQIEITATTRESVQAWIEASGL